MTFPLVFNIGPYFDTVWVVNLLAGGSRTVTALNPWNATAGLHWCSLGELDYWIYVRGGPPGPDAGVDSILVPSGIMGTLSFVPQARYFCYGSALCCTTWFWIRDSNGIEVYDDQSPVMLPPGGRFTVAYSPCTLRTPGYYVASCSVYSDSDINRLNDVMHQPFRVGTRFEYDVGIEDILIPAIPDSGMTIWPRVVIGNYGLFTETFPVYILLPGGYHFVREITLDPGVLDTISFPVWRAEFPPVCTVAMAWTLLEGDQNPSNDTMIKPFTIQVRDIEVRILWPKGTIPDTIPCYPICEVSNRGTTIETFELLFCIGLSVMRESIFDMPPRTTDTVYFSEAWMPSPGIWLARAEAIPVHPDPDPRNNVAYETVYVFGSIRHDVGVAEITSPVGTRDTAGVLDVGARVQNYGRYTQTFWTYFSILDSTNALVYYDSVSTESLASGSSAALTFRQADINIEGYYTARCSTYLATDQNWTNNLVTTMFEMRGMMGFPYECFEAARVPSAPSGRPVKHGGWATAHEGNNLIYVAKGYKTNDFYSYAPAPPNEGGGTWTTLCGMPYETHPLWGNKPPHKGAKGATDSDNKIYVTQGNNTLGWWCYDIAEDTWYVLTDVPLGPFGYKVKGGTDLVYVPGDTGYVYCLKGYRSEFYRWNTVSGRWEVLEDAPTGARNRWDRGSWLVWDGDRYLYAHKAKYHELHRYDLETQKWDSAARLTGMPHVGMMGRRKKSKDGGSAAYYDGFIWALKGGNTSEWWKYDIAADTWIEQETLPAFGSTGRKKRVKYGADVVHWGRGALFFMAKGNKTLEFWGYYEPPEVYSAKPSRSHVTGSEMPMGEFGFDVIPNPFRTSAATRFALPGPSRVDLAVYSSDGRRVRTLACERLGAGRYEVVWDGCDEAGRPIARSVYYLRFVAGDCVLQKKLVKTE